MKDKWALIQRFVAGSLKPAVQMPNSDKLARFNLLAWGGLMIMVMLTIVMVTLIRGWAWPFWLGFNIGMLAIYTTVFVWSVEGWFYRRDIQKRRRELAAFDEMIKHM